MRDGAVIRTYSEYLECICISTLSNFEFWVFPVFLSCILSSTFLQFTFERRSLLLCCLTLWRNMRKRAIYCCWERLLCSAPAGVNTSHFWPTRLQSGWNWELRTCCGCCQLLQLRACPRVPAAVSAAHHSISQVVMIASPASSLRCKMQRIIVLRLTLCHEACIMEILNLK